jgi:general secretion pathway protein K
MRRRERGAALLLVLWVFMLLGVLAFDFGQYMRDDAMAAINLAEETRGYYLAVAGMNRAIYDRVLTDAQENVQGEGAEQAVDDAQPSLIQVDGEWHQLELLGGTVEVRLSDEAARVPLGVPLDSTEDGAVGAQGLGALLTAVVTNLVRGGNQTQGMDTHEQKRIQMVVNSILDWLDPDDERREPDGAEADHYEGLEPPRVPKNGPLDSPEELLQVNGVDAALFYGTEGRPGLRDVISVFNPAVAINLRYASTPVLQALFGIDAEEAQDLIVDRMDPGAGWPIYLERVASLAQAGGQGLLQVDEDGVLTPIEEDSGEDPTDVDAAAVVLVEGRADMSASRNRSRVAAVILLDDLDCDSESLSYCRSVASEGVTVLRWYDRGPWSYDDERAEPASSEDVTG